jgi:glycosyltransferase involved in cell wall biosynthesis
MNRTAPPTPRRIALVTLGIGAGGEVTRVARWLRDGLRSSGYTVGIHLAHGHGSSPGSRTSVVARPRPCPPALGTTTELAGMISTRSDSTPKAFKVLVISAGFEPGFRYGGPVRSVVDIIDSVSNDVDVDLITRDRDLGSRTPYPDPFGGWTRRDRALVFYLNTNKPGQWLHLERQLGRLQFDLLYVNSLWNPTFTVLPVVATRLGVIRAKRILIAPRGEFAPSALSLKRRKKALFLKWWGPFLRRRAVTWHASTEREASDIRTVCPWAHILVVPPQVSLPEEPLPAERAHAGPARFVFISRISPMKNLEMVLEALQHLSQEIEFDIYGPAEDAAYWSKCRSLIRQAPNWVHVKYGGELPPSRVRDTFSSYDAFILPTRGENFGHVIAESLSSSCPVVCSDRTPWTEVLEAGGGVVVRPLTPATLARELGRLADLNPAQRLKARRAAGRAYRTWRRSVAGENIVEKALLSDALDQP